MLHFGIRFKYEQHLVNDSSANANLHKTDRDAKWATNVTAQCTAYPWFRRLEYCDNIDLQAYAENLMRSKVK